MPDRNIESTGGFGGKAGMVTGGGHGIGLAAARLFAARGASVTIFDVDAEAGQKAVEDIQSQGGVARFVLCDVRDEAQVELAVDAAARAYGRMDFAFNNAGVTETAQLTAERSTSEYRRVIETDLSGVFFCMKYQIPHMLAQGGGAIVNTSSNCGLRATPGMASYAAAKHALIGLSRSTAVEYAARGIRVNAICPGAIRTAQLDGWVKGDAAIEAQIVNGIPMRRLGEPEDIARAVAWLCSSEADYVTGIVLPVDGGMTA